MNTSNHNNKSGRKRILVLGATGMLGHVMWSSLSQHHEVYGTTRMGLNDLQKDMPFFHQADESIIDNIEAFNKADIERAFEISRPAVAINCIGMIKQLPNAKNPIQTIYLNSLFPHIVAEICREHKARFMTFSTDCVFLGKKGMYSEADVPDASDLYGRTKLLGEVTGKNCLTIRTSMIGRELSGTHSLLEWFLSQDVKVKGYRKAVFSGLTTHALADITRTLIEMHPDLEGLYHVSADPINKYDLLIKIKRALQLKTEIMPHDELAIDRSLNSRVFRETTSIYIPTWDEMIARLADVCPQYDEWRRDDTER